ncbi:MAG: epoxyqueuosine reductase [Desulfobacteraceae bacterium]|jgi:epoxyqueuosine reductase QueG|nr:MAG: epoxyqueuosine reductase [Desulfobacteraceae bacterium]
MTIDSDWINERLREAGIDLVGIAGAQDLILAYPPRPATALMPSARSVIVMAVAHSLGAVCSPDIMLWTRNKMQTSRLLDETAEKMGRMLEREGFLSLPISADKPVEIFKHDPETGKRFRQTRTLGFLSFKHAAVSCGMGEIGKNNLLLTPEFGPHQRLCAIITEAELAPDPRQAFHLCTRCNKCIDACPSGALTKDGYDVDPCFVYWSLGFKRLPPAGLREWPGYIRMIRRHLKQRDFLVESGQIYITDVDFCIECMRACPVGEKWTKLRPLKIPPQNSGGQV